MVPNAGRAFGQPESAARFGRCLPAEFDVGRRIMDDYWGAKEQFGKARRPMEHESSLTRNFCCAKCRARSAMGRVVALPGGLLPLAGGRYVFVSCTLCGFTEVYSAAVLARLEEERDRLGELTATPVPE